MQEVTQYIDLPGQDPGVTYLGVHNKIVLNKHRDVVFQIKLLPSADDHRIYSYSAGGLVCADVKTGARVSATLWRRGSVVGSWLLDLTALALQKSPDLAKVCKRAPGASATTAQDGNGGIDNAFGKEVLPLLLSFTSTPSKTISDAIVTTSKTVRFFFFA